MRCSALLMIAAACALGSCSPAPVAGPLTMSLIGGPIHLVDPSRSSTDFAAALMLGATAQGLVAFDAEGQVEPALAERWIVTDDGLSYIFRIAPTEWSNGTPVTSLDVVNRLNIVLAGSGGGRLKPLLGNVRQVINMTGRVVEIRLRSPQPNFLQLMAQPEMALFKGSAANGSGPYRIHSVRGGITRLRPRAVSAQEDVATDPSLNDVRIRGEMASRAVARFAARDTALVIGGGFNDLALARAARPANSQFQIDPAYGLFGLAVSSDSTVLAEERVRRAVAMAIDRDRLVQLFGLSNWKPASAILPNQLDSAAPPAQLEWVSLSQEERISLARTLLPKPVTLPAIRLALPPGDGARLLFAALSADWRRIGISARRVGPRDAADLRLIDEVAPQSSAIWYLTRLSCARGLPCLANGETALKAALNAPTLSERANAIAEADAAFAGHQAFIPLALPLRWSLVSPELVGWRASAFAIHPLQHLRGVRQ